MVSVMFVSFENPSRERPMSERLAYLIMIVSVPILWVLAIQVSGF